MSQISCINKLLQDLGTGLSVQFLCQNNNITFDELCSLAEQNHELFMGLRKWYPKYDFTVKQTVNNIDEEENAEGISTRKHVRKRKATRTEQDNDGSQGSDN